MHFNVELEVDLEPEETLSQLSQSLENALRDNTGAYNIVVTYEGA